MSDFVDSPWVASEEWIGDEVGKRWGSGTRGGRENWDCYERFKRNFKKNKKKKKSLSEDLILFLIITEPS